jgi:flagellar protein FliL
VGQAETAAVAAVPGKIFRPDGTLQVSVNHSRPSFPATAKTPSAPDRARDGLFCVPLVGCARISPKVESPSGAVMATTKEAESEAENAEAEGEEGKAAPKRKLSLKFIAMVVGGLVGLGAIGGGGSFLLAGGHDKAEAAASAAGPQIKPVVFLDMPDVLVNLSSTGGSERTQYLKVKVTLELPNEAMSAQIQPVMPRLMDAFQTYLRELRPSDLDGSAGLYRLKEELTRRVNAAIAPSRINAVLFKEIVVQ